MIYGVGIDMVSIDRVLNAAGKEPFFEKVYTESERRQAERNRKRLAGDFAVKEAVSKSFCTGVRGFGLSEIEVLRDELGCPSVTLVGKARELSEKLGITKILVSISDEGGFAVAVAIAVSGE